MNPRAEPMVVHGEDQACPDLVVDFYVHAESAEEALRGCKAMLENGVVPARTYPKARSAEQRSRGIEIFNPKWVKDRYQAITVELWNLETRHI